MDNLGKIRKIFEAQDPATFTPDSLAKEEWVMMEELYHEHQTRYATLKSLKQWVSLTVLLPSGLLNDEEKINIISLVMSRSQKRETDDTI